MKKAISYIYEAAGLPEAEAHEKQKEENNNPLPVEEQKDETQENNAGRYSEELLRLFHWHTELLDELTTMSYGKIATQIKKWAKKMDERKMPLIENPGNYGNKSAYARALKEKGLITCSVGTFRRLL